MGRGSGSEERWERADERGEKGEVGCWWVDVGGWLLVRGCWCMGVGWVLVGGCWWVCDLRA